MKSLEIIRELIIASRPEWCFIFSGVALMLQIYFHVPLDYLWIGILSIFLFGWGHFSLNAWTDKESDKLNSRKFSLRNPLTDDKTLLTKNHIAIWVSFLWFFVWLLNIIAIPNPSLIKWLVGTILFSTAFIGSLSYSLPQFGRLKARPIFDLLSTAGIFAIFIPIYLHLIPSSIAISDFKLIITNVTTLNRLLEGLLFTNLLLLGIHMPTVLGDIIQDKIVGDITTAVWLEDKKEGLAYYFTSTLIVTRVCGFAIMNLYLMNIGILMMSFVPFLLGIIEIILVIILLVKKDQKAAINLWKGVVVTSSLGGILFGILYFSANPTILNHYLAWF